MKNIYALTSLHKIAYYSLLMNSKGYLQLLPNQIVYATARWKGVANWWGQAHSHLLNNPHRPDCKSLFFTSQNLPVCSIANLGSALLHPP
jgi:hypothetical protein